MKKKRFLRQKKSRKTTRRIRIKASFSRQSYREEDFTNRNALIELKRLKKER